MRVVALRDYVGAVEAAGVDAVPVEAILDEAFWPPRPWLRRVMLAQPGLMYAVMTHRLRQAAPAVVAAVERAVGPGDVVVAGLATAGVAAALAPRNPVVLALFAPVVPSAQPRSAVLAVGVGSRRSRGPLTSATSSFGWLLSVGMSGRAGRLMRSEGGECGGGLTAARVLELPILMATDPVLVPRPSDWPPGVRQTGFWIGQSNSRRTSGPIGQGPGGPAEPLEAFLAAGPAPVFVGFGSCPVADAAADLRMFVAAARSAGVRIVVQPGAVVDVPDENVFVMGEADHAEVFPRLAGVVHHGGAGTTTATIRAGVPSAVVPHLGDQFYWGRRVHELGLSPAPVPRSRLTAGRLAKLLRTLTGREGDAMRVRARSVAAGLLTDGVERAADAVLGQARLASG